MIGQNRTMEKPPRELSDIEKLAVKPGNDTARSDRLMPVGRDDRAEVEPLVGFPDSKIAIARVHDRIVRPVGAPVRDHLPTAVDEKVQGRVERQIAPGDKPLLELEVPDVVLGQAGDELHFQFDGKASFGASVGRGCGGGKARAVQTRHLPSGKGSGFGKHHFGKGALQWARRYKHSRDDAQRRHKRTGHQERPHVIPRHHFGNCGLVRLLDRRSGIKK